MCEAGPRNMPCGYVEMRCGWGHWQALGLGFFLPFFKIVFTGDSHLGLCCIR